MDKAEKQKLSESDICDLFITPFIKQVGWDQFKQVRRDVALTTAPVIVRGNLSARNKQKKFADYVLSRQPDLPLVIVEAKDSKHGVSDGLQHDRAILGHVGASRRLPRQKSRPATRQYRIWRGLRRLADIQIGIELAIYA